MTKVRLDGCRPEPLSSYLTGLAVLRLVSEQKDSDARGWWDQGVFHLDSCLNREELIDFFHHDYIPTPIVSPWNGGSGFAEGDKNEGMRAILQSNAERFGEYRRTIETIQSFPEMPDLNHTAKRLLSSLQEEADKIKGKKRGEYLDLIATTRSLTALVRPLSPDEDLLDMRLDELEEVTNIRPTAAEKERIKAIKKVIASLKKARTTIKSIHRSASKEQIIMACRDRLSEDAVKWIDAAAIIDPEGNEQYPPILGSGGNDGRLEFSKMFMVNLALLLIDKPELSPELLNNALFNEQTHQLQVSSVGQYDPGRSGGFNQGAEFETKDFPVNPWRYIFTLEGTIPWASSVARRQKSDGKSFLRSPFSVRLAPVGYTSSSEADLSSGRAEIWAPLWDRPANYAEIRMLLSEGRADVGRIPASNGIEFAEAVTSLGTDRGISEFVRYSIVQRRGNSYVALPAGRFPVQFRSESDLVRELTPLLALITVKGDEAPARLLTARRMIDEAIYTLLLHGGAFYVKNLIAAIGRLERIAAQSGSGNKRIVYRPLSGLSPQWILAADDGSIEMRIATALSSIGATGGVGPIRANLAPVDPRAPWKWSDGSRGQMAWEGNSLTARLTSVLSRRMMDAERLGTEYNPLWGSIRINAEDVSALIEGDLDESLIEDILFGLTWIRWNDKEAVSRVRKELRYKHHWGRPVRERLVPRSFALLKLLFLPHGIRKGDEAIAIKPEPSIIPLLRAGRISDALPIAGRRLRISGLIPMTASFPDGEDGLRIAAALLLPMQDEEKMMRLILQAHEKTI